jgi:hypothetical protein
MKNAKEYLREVWLFDEPNMTFELEEVVELMEEYSRYRVRYEIKKLHKPDAVENASCNHVWKSGFSCVEGDYMYCIKCNEKSRFYGNN